MLPYITIFGKTVSVYGIFVILGILAAVLYFKFFARVSREDRADVELAFIYGVIGAFVGAKLLSILTQLPEFINDWPCLFTQTQEFLKKYLYAGFVFYGGLYGALAAVFIYAKMARVSLGSLLRPLLPAVPLAHGFGRIGCFFAGCCYGIPADGFLGVVFTNSETAPNGVALIPVQLFEAAGEFAVFAVLSLMARKNLRCRILLGFYLTVYGVMRFLLEFLRGDDYRGFIGALSVSQFISVITVILGAALLIYDQMKRGRTK